MGWAGHLGIPLLGLVLAGPCALAAEPPAFVKAPKPAVLQMPAASEASGLAAAVRGGEFLWLVNDSGGAPVLYLAGTDGADRGQVTVKSATNVDWEDLAGFSWQGKPYLLIADTGDNLSNRSVCTLYIVPEPALPSPGQVLKGAVEPAWTLAFRYPEGPRDCEAVAVDAAGGKVLLISKRTTPPEVYELPLQPAKSGLVVARKIGLTAVKPPAGLPHPYGAQPTGLDLSADGTMAAVVSYVSVFIFPKSPQETWAAAFARKPLVLPRHGLRQAESIAFSRNGQTLFIVSEGTRSPIVTYQLHRGG